jgi:hypothetical protein
MCISQSILEISAQEAYCANGTRQLTIKNEECIIRVCVRENFGDNSQAPKKDKTGFLYYNFLVFGSTGG